MRRKSPEVLILPSSRPLLARAMMLTVAVTCLLSSRPAGAEEAQGSVPGQHEHDGLYFRVLAGVGYTRISSSDDDLTAKGSSGTFGLALGYNVARNLILYAELFDDIAVDPSVESGGMEQTLEDAGVGVIGWGLGAAYYFMPVNAYASVTLAASRLTLDTGDGESIDSDWGLGASLVGGKEWWVSDNWGLGAAAHFYLGGIPDGGQTLTTVAAALVLSATYD